jgi:hypothetical protein
VDVFAPGYPLPGHGTFVVLNTSRQNKTINIFQYPINQGATRDILQIPGVGEADIRASLLKGELRHKILVGDIIVLASDVDLLQFNIIQRTFLQNAGIATGLQVTVDQFAIIQQQDIELVGLVNGINNTFTIPSGTWIQNHPYTIIVYVNGVKQVMNDDYIIAEGGGVGTGYNTVIFSISPESIPMPLDVVTADYYINNSTG